VRDNSQEESPFRLQQLLTRRYLKLLALNHEKKKLLLKWKEEKQLEEKDAELAFTRGIIEKGAGYGNSTDGLMRNGAAEIEDRANARLKVSMWKAQKEAEKEQIMVLTCIAFAPVTAASYLTYH
jgi:hypothetical protein